LQFGFQKGIGCANAIYVAQQVVEHFNSRCSTVFLSSLDASKAFDRVKNGIIVNKLIYRNVPCCLINVIADCYCKLFACVCWNGDLSYKFHVLFGVRQE